MTLDVALGILRAILTTAGGVAVADGYATNDQWTAIAGGIVALVGAVWSILSKRTAAKAVATALATPVPEAPPATVTAAGKTP